MNEFDLNLTGSEMPDNLAMGQNLHITAVVEEYDEISANKEQKPNSSLEIMRNSAFLFSTSQYAAEQQTCNTTDN